MALPPKDSGLVTGPSFVFIDGGAPRGGEELRETALPATDPATGALYVVIVCRGPLCGTTGAGFGIAPAIVAEPGPVERVFCTGTDGGIDRGRFARVAGLNSRFLETVRGVLSPLCAL